MTRLTASHQLRAAASFNKSLHRTGFTGGLSGVGVSFIVFRPPSALSRSVSCRVSRYCAWHPAFSARLAWVNGTIQQLASGLRYLLRIDTVEQALRDLCELLKSEGYRLRIASR
jgi:hypothetical protein